MMLNTMKAKEKEKMPMLMMPISWLTSWAPPARPPKMPTARVPHMPATRWTDMAPTGSSILTLSKNSTEKTTMAPAMMADRATI